MHNLPEVAATDVAAAAVGVKPKLKGAELAAVKNEAKDVAVVVLVDAAVRFKLPWVAAIPAEVTNTENQLKINYF